MWAIGVLLFTMLTGTFPFRGISESDLYYKIQRGNFKVPDFVSKDAKRIINRLLETDYRRRMTAKELLNDPWLKSYECSTTTY
jgi:serine/threonine protein kinase